MCFFSPGRGNKRFDNKPEVSYMYLYSDGLTANP